MVTYDACKSLHAAVVGDIMIGIWTGSRLLSSLIYTCIDHSRYDCLDNATILYAHIEELFVVCFVN